MLVDLRSPTAFATVHPKAALNLPFSSRSLVERLVSVLPPGKPVILFAEDVAQTHAAFAQLQGGSIHLLGAVKDGIEGWQAMGLPTESLPEMSVQELVDGLASGKLVVLDVREPMEWEVGHVPDAILIPLGEVRQQLHLLPRASCIAVICESGIRSCIAASILKAEGFADVANVIEGTRGYRHARLPLQFWTQPETSGNDEASV